MRFADPAYLAFLVLPLGLALARWVGRGRTKLSLAFGSFPLLAGLPITPRTRWRRLPGVLELTGLTLLILAFARPQQPSGVEAVRLRSRNIILALDISSSMKATDFQPGNRVTVAREVAREFTRRRQGDLVGLVIFAGRAFLQAPLTTDLDLLDRILEQVDIGLLPDGTAIGTALATSLNQLKDLPHDASVIVLLTDGANNTGQPLPLQAAEAARTLGVRVHAIGLTSPDTTSTALNGVWSVRSLAARLTGRDEAALERIAARTGGQYYRASDPTALRRIMDEIDRVERVEVTVRETRRYRELFPWALTVGLLLLAMERLLTATWLRAVPA
jgi:Ca-activated chloride channel family protein